MIGRFSGLLSNLEDFADLEASSRKVLLETSVHDPGHLVWLHAQFFGNLPHRDPRPVLHQPQDRKLGFVDQVEELGPVTRSCPGGNLGTDVIRPDNPSW